MRRLPAVTVFVAVFVAAFSVPGVASADVIFDQADADELATTLADAYEAQGVCYGWSIDVDNEGLPETSTGSNFGAGRVLADEGGSCASSVEFQASITWTSESSESEDSANYQVVSTPSGPSTGDLDDLEILSTDGLVSDDVDVDVYKAVAALPLLAADAGMADPIQASPAPETDAGEAAPTNSPGSDFWRESGMLILWGALLLLAGGVFAWYAIRSSRRPARRTLGPVAEQIPEHVPTEWILEPERAPDAEPASGPEATGPEPTPEPESTERAEPAEPAGSPPAEPEKPGTKPKPDPDTRPEG